MAGRVPGRAGAWVGHGALLLLAGLALRVDTRARDAFSWMDPYQYYDFALGVLRGHEHFGTFEVASVFPFFVMPLLAIDASIPTALLVNLAFTPLLLFAVHRLCGALRVETPSVIVAALVLSSPLLLGLSRTLYVEFALTTLVAAAFVPGLRLLDADEREAGGHAVAFGLVLAVGFLTKMTFPLFFVLPVGFAVLARRAARRPRQAAVMLAAAVIPLALALAIGVLLFPGSAGYYLSFGNTAIPVMRLIGPSDPLSFASAGFYFGEVGRTLLFLLTPLLLLPLWQSTGRLRGLSFDERIRRCAGPRAALWLWLVGPLLLLVAQPVKEPRHVAPCVVPAVLLVVLGIEGVRAPGARRILLGATLALAALQFSLVRGGVIETPYFLRRALHYREIQDRMLGAEPGLPRAGEPEALRLLHWRYGQNLAIAGFPANEALALIWQSFPAVSFDLETFEDPARFREAHRPFADLYLLAAFNTYNRRCGWRRYVPTLSRQEVVAHADFVILNAPDATAPERSFPDHEVLASIDRTGGAILLLRHRGDTTPYRTLYARAFLERRPPPAHSEARAAARELLVTAALTDDRAGALALLREFPALRSGAGPVRNVYWLARYRPLLELAERRLRATALPGR